MKGTAERTGRITNVAFNVRPAGNGDREAVWRILEPVIREGEAYALPRDINQDEALDYWYGDGHEVFVAEDRGDVIGTYFLRTNQPGGGDHVANCGYATAVRARGRGVARAMLEHSLSHAQARRYRAMQFNFVVSTNERAVKTWLAYGFQTVGRLPAAFRHPQLGFVDVLIMYKQF
jgi:GNAT superfamily N-acetyltransferase